MSCQYCANGVVPFYEIKEVVGGNETGRTTTICHTCQALGVQPVFQGEVREALPDLSRSLRRSTTARGSTGNSDQVERGG